MFSKTSEGTSVQATTGNVKHRVLLTVSALLVGSALALMLSGSFASAGSDVSPTTPGWGVTQTPVASGVLPEPVRVKIKHDGGFGDGLEVSNVSIVKNIVVPGGYFGWHQHGGPSWIVVTQGTLTFYDAEDPNCTGHPVSAGNAFLDMGNHTHNARNETNAPVENYVVRMLPVGGTVRIDMPAPETCDF